MMLFIKSNTKIHAVFPKYLSSKEFTREIKYNHCLIIYFVFNQKKVHVKAIILILPTIAKCHRWNGI